MAKSFKESISAIQNSDIQTFAANTPILLSLDPDTEPEITVDMDTRTITVPKELQNIGVVDDNNAETVYIRVPTTTFDGIILTDKTAYIKYINAGNEYNAYEITETEVEGDTIKLGWTIDNNVTRYAGIVSFQLTFELDTNYQWSTVPATINILSGLNMSAAVAPSETAIVSALFNRVANLEALTQILSERIENDRQSTSGAIDRIGTLEKDIEHLKDNVVYILTDTDEEVI